jgi:hypothetical protein
LARLQDQADYELETDLLGRRVCAHDTGKRVAIGDGQRGKA